MKHFFLILLISLITAASTNAQNIEEQDSVAKQSESLNKTNTTIKSISSRKKKNQLNNKQENLSAIDNSQRLLAEADSLSHLYREYRSEKMMFLPIIFVEYQDIDEKPIKADSLSLAQRRDTARLDFDQKWLEQAEWDNWFENSTASWSTSRGSCHTT